VAVTVDHDPGAPPDTTAGADRQFTVEVTPHGEGGWTAPPDRYECFVTLTRNGLGALWLVATLRTDQ
jgi:hypothetical protein